MEDTLKTTVWERRKLSGRENGRHTWDDIGTEIESLEYGARIEDLQIKEMSHIVPSEISLKPV